MHMKQLILSVAAALAIGTGAGDVSAHESAHQGTHKAADVATKKEQKPWGIAGDPQTASRTLAIAMGDDMRFTPSTLEVKQGETVRFVVTNKGRLLHEMVIGDRKSLDEHAALMAKFPTMEHDEPFMAHVSPGRQETLVWTFNRAGEFEFACLVDGHFKAGMLGTIKVVAGNDAVAAQAGGIGADTTPASPAGFTEGEVRKVDRSAGKITVKHGEIRNLDMPPMTMVFRVVDQAMLEQVKAGDKVRFRAADEGGQLTITQIQPVQ
jgi:uncharacterized cupredoxin-like copper-binding protein